MKAFVSFVTLTLAMFSGACDTCPARLIISVSVRVTDSTGSAVDATVRYALNGAPERDCIRLPVQGEYRCGIDEPGEFVISATLSGVSKNERVLVRADGCHVEPQRVQFMF
jgi:hypothetical protein